MPTNEERIDQLTQLCRHLYEALASLAVSEGTKGLKGSIAARSMEPHLAYAESLLHELTT